MTNTVLSSPIPAYQNLPIEAGFYQPSRFVIDDVVLGETTTVTTTIDHNYVIGQQCRLIIPKGYGCTQLNEKSGLVEEIPSTTQVVLRLDSKYGDPFISANLSQQPQILAIGDSNTGSVNANGRTQNITYIQGSFINISPET